MTLLSTIRAKGPAAPYDADIAYHLSIISTWCYGDEQALRQVLARQSMAASEPEVRAYRVYNPALPVDANGFLITLAEGFHVLSFRGTEPTHLVDVLTDALVEQHIWREAPDEWVHRGFYLSMDVLWPQLANDLRALEGDLYITGHSLGGAMAVLAGRRILDSAPTTANLQGVYTFGQPMVGNEEFARQSGALNLHRHVYDPDLVPYLPPIGVCAGDYVHFGMLHEAVAGRGEKIWRPVEGGDDSPKSCHISEILPAFLTPLMERLQFPSVPLLATSFGLRAFGLALSMSSLRDVRDTPKVLGRRLSFEHHIPTHYVDISRASRPGSAHSMSASKRSGGADAARGARHDHP